MVLDSLALRSVREFRGRDASSVGVGRMCAGTHAHAQLSDDIDDDDY